MGAEGDDEHKYGLEAGDGSKCSSASDGEGGDMEIEFELEMELDSEQTPEPGLKARAPREARVGGRPGTSASPPESTRQQRTPRTSTDGKERGGRDDVNAAMPPTSASGADGREHAQSPPRKMNMPDSDQAGRNCASPGIQKVQDEVHKVEWGSSSRELRAEPKRAVACAQHTNAGVGMSEAWDSTSSDDDERASPAFDQLRASVAMLGDQVRRDSQDAAAFSPQSQVRVWEEKAGGVPMDNSWVHENWDESSDDGCERDANV